MRRVTIVFSAAVLLIALAPASALARHRGHSARHHHRTHHARRHSRLERFGDQSTSGTTSSATSAGKVKSFQGGLLTITLADGITTVSGRVSNDTEIECMAPQAMHTEGDSGSGDGGSGDDQSASGGQTSGDDQGDAAEQNETQAEDQNETEAEDQNENEAEDQNDPAENETEAESTCSSSSLTMGATVREAELSVSSSGSVWKKVELAS